jgi:site-specific DNA-methyltransferase (adenine-specific)
VIRPEIQSLATPITKLKPHPQNVRQGDIGAISISLEQHGQYRPIVVQQSTGFILAGNHTYKAAKALKWKDIAATFVDVDDEEALRILLIDNRANDLASYDDSALVEMLKALMDTELKLDGTGFDPSDLDQLLKDLEMETGNPIEGDPDAVPDDAPSKTVPGDVWLLGDHRLMCGDSTTPTDVSYLMNGQKAGMVFTDPPYGVSYQSNMRTQSEKFKVLKNDDVVLQITPNIKQFSNGWVFVWTTWKVIDKWIDATKELGYPTNMIVWDKGGGGIGDLEKTFSTDYEIALVWHRDEKLTAKRLGSVWGFNKDGSTKYLHPTQKPVALAKQAIETTTNLNTTVLDLFGGSGSTLIAAHQTGRIAYLMELDPHYCDVICKRFQQATGITPIAEATGNEHSFIE